MTDTAYEPSAELRKAFMDAFYLAWNNGWSSDGLDAGLRAIAPLLIAEGMERAANVADSWEATALTLAGNKKGRAQVDHALTADMASDIAAAIRAAKA